MVAAVTTGLGLLIGILIGFAPVIGLLGLLVGALVLVWSIRASRPRSGAHHEGSWGLPEAEFATDRGDADETIEVILDGSMPPGYYTSFGLHPEANLTAAEIDELVAGLRDTPGMSEGDDDEGDDN